MKVLLIEDDIDILEVITLSFRMGWPDAGIVSTNRGTDGIELVEKEIPDIILLDLLLPDMDGFEVLTEIRAFSDVPVIIVSVKGEEVDRIKGLEMGADDYVLKPFGYMELMARVRAVMRRGKTWDSTFPANIECDGLAINFRLQEVRLHGKEIKLTPIEYRLLCELVLNHGSPVSQKNLIERVWGEEYLDEPNVLKVHIHRLRRKLDDQSDDPQRIATVFRRGYKFNGVATKAAQA